MQNLSPYVLSLFTIIPHPNPTFQLGSRYLAYHIIEKLSQNSCRSGSIDSAAQSIDGCAIDRCLRQREIHRSRSMIDRSRKSVVRAKRVAIAWQYGC